MEALREILKRRTRRGELYRTEGASIRCFSCGHRCLIHEGREGICKVRANVAGELLVPWGYVGGLQLDPIEKKPFFHVFPGAKALSFGMLGCDFHCAYCQNWFTSQALRDPSSVPSPTDIDADSICSIASREGAMVITSTYNEPLITSEWAIEVFKRAHARGLKTSYVSNGNGTSEVLEYLRPHLDYFKIDLKSFRDRAYRQMGGVLKNVLDTIIQVAQLGFWCEIVTLVIPGFNDDETELRELARFVKSVSCDIPWHITAFHPDYKMREPPNTSVQTLLRAAEVGKEEGLNYVYIGNLPGLVGKWENTFCSHCHRELIERKGFRVLKNWIKDSRCPYCRVRIPGVWQQ